MAGLAGWAGILGSGATVGRTTAVIALASTGALTLAVAERRLGRDTVALGGLALAMVGAWLALATHRVLVVPRVDTLTWLGMDASRWLVLPACLLLLATAPGALGGRPRRATVRERALAGCFLVGVGLDVAWWITPQTWFEEVVELDRPGDMPIVRDGRLEHHPWDRALRSGRPIERVPAILANEALRADLARGLATEAGARGSALPRVLGPALIVGHLVLTGVLVLGAPLVVVGAGSAPLRTVATAALVVLLGLAPVVNLGLALMAPDADRGAAMVRDLGQLVLVAVAGLAGLDLRRGMR